jgi:hypothetical protein
MVLERDRRSASESRSIDKAPGDEWSWGFLLVQTSVTIIQRLKGNGTTCDYLLNTYCRSRCSRKLSYAAHAVQPLSFR